MQNLCRASKIQRENLRVWDCAVRFGNVFPAGEAAWSVRRQRSDCTVVSRQILTDLSEVAKQIRFVSFYECRK